MWDIRTYLRNKKLCSDIGVAYGPKNHDIYHEALDEFKLPHVSVKKFSDDVISKYGETVGYVDENGDLTEEQTNTMRCSEASAKKLPKYLEALSRATGHEIVKGGASTQTALFTRTGWTGHYSFHDNGENVKYLPYVAKLTA